MPIPNQMENDEQNRDYSVYVHLFPNGKRYVGITCRPVNRRWEGGSGYATQPYMARAIRKYGWDNVAHLVICEHMTLNEATAFEVEWIKHWRTSNPRYGYNVDHGGLTCGKHSEATKAKIRTNRKGKCTGENNCKFGSNMKGENNPFFGMRHTEESRDKMSAARLSRPMRGSKNPWARRVVCDGREYGSVVECAEHYGIHHSVLSGYLSGNRKISSRFVNMGLRYAERREYACKA